MRRVRQGSVPEVRVSKPRPFPPRLLPPPTREDQPWEWDVDGCLSADMRIDGLPLAVATLAGYDDVPRQSQDVRSPWHGRMHQEGAMPSLTEPMDPLRARIAKRDGVTEWKCTSCGAHLGWVAPAVESHTTEDFIAGTKTHHLAQPRLILIDPDEDATGPGDDGPAVVLVEGGPVTCCCACGRESAA